MTDLDKSGNPQPWLQNSYQGPTLGNIRTSVGRRSLLAPLTVFIDNVNGNDLNDGLSAAHAFQTFAAAAAFIFNYVDTQGFNVTIQAAAGQTWTNLLFSGTIVGGGNIIFDVGGGTITGNAGFALKTAQSNNITPLNSFFQLQNCTITGSAASNGLWVAAGTLLLGAGITFGSCIGGAHIFCDSPASRVLVQNYTITGSAASHYNSLAAGLIDVNNAAVTITLTGTPAFSVAFAVAGVCGMILAFATYSGSATGVRFVANLNGVIWTNTGNVNWLPGNSPGTTGTGGQYA